MRPSFAVEGKKRGKDELGARPETLDPLHQSPENKTRARPRAKERGVGRPHFLGFLLQDFLLAWLSPVTDSASPSHPGLSGWRRGS